MALAHLEFFGAAVLIISASAFFLPHEDGASPGRRPNTPSAAELRSHIVLTEPTLPITIRFQSPFKIAATDPAAARHKGYDRVAYSTASPTTPCNVTLPSGMPIIFNPEHQEANFLNPNDAETVAHELLHCLRWNWHGDRE